MESAVYQKYGFTEWPGYIAMMGAQWRAEKAEHERQLAALNEDERALYDCLLHAVGESANRALYREGWIEVKPGAAALAAAARDPHLPLDSGSLRRFLGVARSSSETGAFHLSSGHA
jgi:hypothetical protein